MAINLKEFESLGGFSIGETSVIDKDKNAQDLNSIEMKNSFYSDSKTTNYILHFEKNNKLYFLSGILIGLFSNLIGLFNSNYSSSAFIFKKAI